MIINPNMNSIGGVSHSDFVRNAQHVGMQRQGVSKTEGESPEVAQDAVQISSQARTEETGKSGKAGQTGDAEQAGQSGQTGETGQAGQTGQAGNAGQAGQTGQTGNAGQAGQTGSSEEAENPGEQTDGGCGNSSGVDYNSGMPGASMGGAQESQNTQNNSGANPGANTGGSNEEGSVANNPVEEMKLLQQLEAEQQQVEAIWIEMMEARRKHMADMMKIIMDTQTSINEIVQAICQTQIAVSDRVMEGWDKVIWGGR